MAGIDRFTKLLLHCDGANNSTVFTDSAGLHTATASGNAKIITATPKFGTGRMEGDGTANTFVALDGSSDFAFGTGDFTIDFWVAFLDLTTQAIITIYDGRSSGGGETTPILYTGSGDKKLHYHNGAGDVILGTTVFIINTYYHIALARASGTAKTFVDGVQQGSVADSNNFVIAASRPLLMGNANVPGSTTLHLNGALDEIRISKGIARWTAAFTPPTKPYSRVSGWWV